MLPIKSFRLVNMKIPDKAYDVHMRNDYYDLDSKDTLLTLANGGGKSSLILILSQVFEPNKARGSRKLMDYVAESGYSVIAVELDQGNTLTTLGLVARRKIYSDSSDQEKEVLDYFLFVSDYQRHHAYGFDPKTLPFYEGATQSRQKSFEDFKSYLKSKPDTFKVYDKPTQYTKYLEERFHNIQSWTDTIWDINRSEGGVSSRFSKSKDSEELVPTREVIREHLTPMIESKNQIDMEEHRLQLQEIGRNYAAQFESEVRRGHLSDIKDQFESVFLASTQQATELNQALNQAYDEYQSLVELLTPLTNFKQSELLSVNEEQQDLVFQTQLIDLSQSELTLTQSQAEFFRCSEAHQYLEEQLDEVTQSLETEQQNVNIQEASYRYGEFTKTADALILKKQEIEAKQLANHEKGLLIQEIEQTLAHSTHETYQTHQDTLKTTQTQLQTLKTNQATLTTETQQTQIRLGELNYQETQLKRELEQLTAKSEELLKQFNADVTDLSCFEQEVKDKKEELIDYREDLTNLITTYSEELEKEETLATALQRELIELQHSIDLKEEQRQQLEQSRTRLLLELSQLLKTDPLFSSTDKEVISQVKEACQSLEKEIQLHLDERVLVQQQLSKRRDLVIPDEIHQWLEREGIAYRQGVDILNELESEALKQEWIERYRIMPYSLVLENPSDLHRLNACPVASLEDLLLFFMVHPDHFLGELSGSWFALSDYRTEMLDFDFWEKRREALEVKDFELSEAISGCRGQISKFQSLETRLESCSMRQIEAQMKELDVLFTTLTKKESDFNLQSAVIGELKGKIGEKKQEKDVVQTQLEDCDLDLQHIQTLQALEAQQVEIKTQFKQCLDEKTVYQAELDHLQNALTAAVQELETLTHYQEEVIRLEDRAKQQFMKYQAFYSESFVPSQFKHQDIQVLETHLTKLRQETDLTALMEDVKALQVSHEEKKEAFEELGIDASICESHPYSKSLKQGFEQAVKRLREEQLRLSGDVGIAHSKLQEATTQLEDAKQKKQEKFNRFKENYPAPLVEHALYREFLTQLKEAKQVEKGFSSLRQQLKSRKDRLKGRIEHLSEQAKVLSSEQTALSGMIKIEAGVKHFDLGLLNVQIPAHRLQVLDVTNFLSELEAARLAYEHQRDHLKDAVNEWNTAYLRAWRLSDVQLSSMPVGNQRFKESHPTVSLDNYQLIIEGMKTLCSHLDLTIEHENERLQEADRQRQSFAESLALRCQEVYEQLRNFDKGLKIKMDGKDQPILTLKVELCVPEHEFESAIQVYIQDYIKELAHLIQAKNLAPVSELSACERKVSDKVDNFKLGTLLAQVIDFDRCVLKVLKMSHLNYTLDYWEHDNSGGQGSLKALILVFAMFKYLSDHKTGTMIILDNPFGKMSKDSLVEVMFKAAERLNIRLLCLTGIEELHIQQWFERQFKLIHNPTKNNRVVMKVEALHDSHRDSVELEHAPYYKSKRPSREELLKNVEQQGLFDLAEEVI